MPIDEWHSCRRKLRHLDFLSAMKHISRFPRDTLLRIYSCSYCGGLHIGHEPKQRASPEPLPPRNSLEGRIQRTRLRLNAAMAIHPKLRNGEKLRRNRERIASLEEHLALLLAEQSMRDLQVAELVDEAENMPDSPYHCRDP